MTLTTVSVFPLTNVNLRGYVIIINPVWISRTFCTICLLHTETFLIIDQLLKLQKPGSYWNLLLRLNKYLSQTLATIEICDKQQQVKKNVMMESRKCQSITKHCRVYSLIIWVCVLIVNNRYFKQQKSAELTVSWPFLAKKSSTWLVLEPVVSRLQSTN